MYKLDVVIPVYGQHELLSKCLDSIPCNDPTFNIVLVNDAGPEIPADLVKKKDCRVFNNRVNVGFPGTVNKGVSKCAAPLVLILNTDVILECGVVDKLIAEMEDPTIGIAAPMLLFPEGTESGPAGKIQHAGIAFDIHGMPQHIFLGWSADNPKPNIKRDWPCVTGACFMTRRSLWKRVGGFNLAYGRGTFEDVEYCISVRSLGNRILMCPELRGSHYVGQSAKEPNKGFDVQGNARLFKQASEGIVKHDDFLYW